MRGYPRKAELLPKAQELRAQGLTVREIAARLGVARSTAAAWLTDPEGKKLRARRPRRTCPDCGVRVDPGSIRCRLCAHAERSRREREASRRWVLAAIREWARLYGEPPAITDWSPYRARALGDEARAVRWERGAWPSVDTVIRAFGSWNDSIAATGLAPRAAHGGGANAARRRSQRTAA